MNKQCFGCVQQATPSLVDVESSAESLSKLTVTGDRAMPVSSRLAHARTAAIATTDSMLLLMRGTKLPTAARVLPSV